MLSRLCRKMAHFEKCAHDKTASANTVQMADCTSLPGVVLLKQLAVPLLLSDRFHNCLLTLTAPIMEHGIVVSSGLFLAWMSIVELHLLLHRLLHHQRSGRGVHPGGNYYERPEWLRQVQQILPLLAWAFASAYGACVLALSFTATGQHHMVGRSSECHN